MKVLLSILLVAALVSACGSGSSGTTGTSGGSTVKGAGTTGSGGTGSTGTTSSTGTSGSTGFSGTPNPVGLWVGGGWALSATALDASGMPAPTDTCNGLVPSNPNAGPAAFDAHGNLWTVEEDANENEDIVEWSAAELGQACSTAAPAIALVDMTPGMVLNAIAFDPQGNLWAANSEEQEVVGYKASDLAASGNITPTWEMQGAGGGTVNAIYSPLGLAFDSAGYLWVGNYFSIMAFSPQTLAAALVGSAGDSPPGDIYLSNSAAIAFESNPSSGGTVGYSDFQYRFLAFDSSGNLWVTVISSLAAPKGGVILEFAKSDLAKLASNPTPTPIFTITETTAEAADPLFDFQALAFDGSGDLWVGSTATQVPNLLEFPPSSFASAGSGLPSVSITLGFSTNVSLAFNPIPAGLPINP